VAKRTRKPKLSAQRQGILDQLNDDEEVIFREPASLDVAIVGLLERFGLPQRIVCYDRAKVIQALIDDGMDGEGDAEEWFEFNTIGAWLGDATPAFVTTVADA
jgi:hypothetical protein